MPKMSEIWDSVALTMVSHIHGGHEIFNAKPFEERKKLVVIQREAIKLGLLEFIEQISNGDA